MNKSVERQEALIYAINIMLINCPRCGFSQPKDKYCAQCGVDIETFKPSQPKLAAKVFGSTVLQVGVLLLLALGAGFFLYQKQHENLQARVRYLKGSLQVSSTDDQPSNKAINANLLESSSSAEAPPPEEGKSANVAEAKAMVPVLGAAAEKKEDEAKDTKDKAAVKSSGPTIHVTYAEVSKNALRSFFEESQNTGQFMSFKDYSAGILPNLQRKLSAGGAGIRVLHKEEYPLAIGKNLQWFYGLKDRQDPDIEIGMTTFIELGEMDGTNYRGNMEIQRSWREVGTGGAAGGIQRRSFPAMFEIGNNSGFFISSVMPAKSNLENDDELTSIDVYKILKSEDFQRGDSDFVIFVELGSPIGASAGPAAGSTPGNNTTTK